LSMMDSTATSYAKLNQIFSRETPETKQGWQNAKVISKFNLNAACFAPWKKK
jgi:hypothetical protein